MADQFPITPPNVTADGTCTALLSVQGGFNQLTVAVRLALNTLATMQANYPALAPDGSTTAPSFSFVNNPTTGLSNNAGTLTLSAATNATALQNGVNSQTLQIHNTYSGASGYSRLEIRALSTVAQIVPTALGNGTLQDLLLGATGAGWTIDVSNASNLYPAVPKSIGRAANPIAKLYVDYTNTATVGAVTINKAAGRVNLAASGTSLFVTNSLATVNSHIMVQAGPSGNLAGVSFSVVAANGSFTISAVPGVTNQTAIDFFMVNAD